MVRSGQVSMSINIWQREDFAGPASARHVNGDAISGNESSRRLQSAGGLPCPRFVRGRPCHGGWNAGCGGSLAPCRGGSPPRDPVAGGGAACPREGGGRNRCNEGAGNGSGFDLPGSGLVAGRGGSFGPYLGMGHGGGAWRDAMAYFSGKARRADAKQLWSL